MAEDLEQKSNETVHQKIDDDKHVPMLELLSETIKEISDSFYKIMPPYLIPFTYYFPH